MADFMILNKRIRQLRLTNNLTAKEFGDIFNISCSSVSLYESGKRTPNINLIIKIAKYFNTTTDYLLGVTPTHTSIYSHMENTNTDILKIIEFIIYLIDNEDNLVFNGISIDKNLMNLLKKSLYSLIETYTFFSINNHIS